MLNFYHNIFTDLATKTYNVPLPICSHYYQNDTEKYKSGNATHYKYLNLMLDIDYLYVFP